ncbi:MAG: ribonucleoside-triphosphate reductase, partial [Candidatus Brennerbacteria bacterium]|nr:ribonucleoside-triphosphate reductase [Candidatus Brennerbacteria bacterium]
AGKAARKTNVTAYNCSYIAQSKLEDFAEIMYLSMCGTGVGFSVESQTVQQLPLVKKQTGEVPVIFTIEDSKEGWGDALTAGMKAWYDGRDIKFDYSKLRPAGARLETMGGRSSGPEPLRALLDFSRVKILNRQGKRLSNLDVHDIVCKIGEVVVMGGVRRTALISLSDLDDEEMRHSKEGQFYLNEPQRQMANNSAVYNQKPTAAEFMEEWLALAKSGTGERGIFNRGELKSQLPERRWKIFEKDAATAGTNPCGEIVLKSKQFCNLTEVICRPEDTEETLIEKIKIAAIIGTYQATLTNFPYLSKEWKKNCEEERLLGVSLSGQWDCPTVRNVETLIKLKEKAIEVNREYAKRFGINQSSAITCVKPSGTVAERVDCSPGMHARHAPFYIRRVRISSTDPLFQMLKDQKFLYHPEVGQAEGSASTYVLEFPVKAPSGSVFKKDLNAIELTSWNTGK